MQTLANSTSSLPPPHVQGAGLAQVVCKHGPQANRCLLIMADERTASFLRTLHLPKTCNSSGPVE